MPTRYSRGCAILCILFCVLSVHGFNVVVKKPRISISSPLNLSLLDQFFKNTSDTNDWPKVSAPPGFVPPDPKPLTITESTSLAGILTSAVGLALRLGTGAFVLGWKIDTIQAPEVNEEGKRQYSLKLLGSMIRLRDCSSVLSPSMQPKKKLVLYDNESCPYCKRVREMLNLLDITYECRPCFETNKNAWGMNNSNQNLLLPYLYDPNLDDTTFGDDEIIHKLLDRYGPPPSEWDRKALWPIEFKAFSVITSQLATCVRGNPGVRQQTNARSDNDQMRPIELWGYECSPFVRPVKEKLCTLCLPHTVVSCSRGSSNRDKMVELTGRFQVPYIVDPNTGIEMFEGAEIVEYLEAVYTKSS